MYPLNLLNVHKKRALISLSFCSIYYYLCKNTVKCQYESIRLGMAGSIANMVCECGFHLVDTINIRSKVLTSSNNMINGTLYQIKSIYAKEGLFGFGKGFSACFYGSILSGFCFFTFYKWIKL